MGERRNLDMNHDNPSSVPYEPNPLWRLVLDEGRNDLDRLLGRATSVLVGAIAQEPDILVDFMIRLMLWSQGRRPVLRVNPKDRDDLKHVEMELLDFIRQDTEANQVTEELI
jgi:hypothetical protein